MSGFLIALIDLALACGKAAGCISGRKGRKGRKGAQRTQRKAKSIRACLRDWEPALHPEWAALLVLRPLRPLYFAYFASNAFQVRLRRVWTACLAALALSNSGAAPAAPVDYRFDPVHSHLQFAADHMGFSTSIGRFTRWQGEFSYDPDDAGANRVDVTIDVASLDLGDANWNQTMLGRKWFDAEHFPQARFVGHRFELIDASHARLHGDLSLKGKTQPITLEVRINRFGTHPYTLKATAGFSASTTLSRSAFGLDALDGTLADAVEIRIEVEGQRAKPLQQRPGKR